MPPWATTVRESLARSRRIGYTFQDAWKRIPPAPSDWLPSTVEFARKAFLRGYTRRGDSGIGVLAEREFAYRDRTVPDVAVERWCGWGGRGGCRDEAREGGFLCPSHSQIIHAAMNRKGWEPEAEELAA